MTANAGIQRPNATGAEPQLGAYLVRNKDGVTWCGVENRTVVGQVQGPATGFLIWNCVGDEYVGVTPGKTYTITIVGGARGGSVKITYSSSINANTPTISDY